MNRRAPSFIAVATAAVLGLGSFEAASAGSSLRGAVSSTQSISACATGHGSLRLPDSSGKCTGGTTKIGLARPAIAPQALALDVRSGTPSETLSLPANTKLKAGCRPRGQGGTSYANLDIVHTGPTQIDGTTFLTENGGTVSFDYNTGGGNLTPTGSSSVYSTTAGGFYAHAGSGEYATLNAHLLVTVPGRVFTIDAIIDANGAPYCRISAEVESAAT